jgi:hypothetical protein
MCHTARHATGGAGGNAPLMVTAGSGRSVPEPAVMPAGGREEKQHETRNTGKDRP